MCMHVCAHVYPCACVYVCVCMCSQIICCCTRHLERGKSLEGILHRRQKYVVPSPAQSFPHKPFSLLPFPCKQREKTSFLENHLASQNVISLTSLFSQLPLGPTPGCQEKGRGPLKDFRGAQRREGWRPNSSGLKPVLRWSSALPATRLCPCC